MSREFTKYAFVAGLLSLLFAAIVVLPFKDHLPSGMFYTIDPDVVYLSNIISLLKTGRVFYFDHPGVLAMALQSFLMLPLVMMVKLTSGAGFLKWTLENFEITTMYARFVSTIIASSGIFLLLTAIYIYTKNFFAVMFAFICLLTFTPIYYAGITISAESTSILLVGIWALFFVKYLRTKRKIFFNLLLAISALAVANRLTALALIPASMFLAVKGSYSMRKNFQELLRSSVVVFIFFVLGVLPVIGKMKELLNWVFLLANKTEVHGGGNTGFVSLKIYSIALTRIATDPAMHIILLLTVLLSALFSFITFHKKVRSQNTDAIFRVFVVILLFIVAFSKYPLIHYQTTNFLVLIILTSFLLSGLSKYLIVLITILFIGNVNAASLEYSSAILSLRSESISLDAYNEAHSSSTAEVWTWSRSKKFALIWARDYTGIYNVDFDKVYPNLFSLDNLTSAKNKSGTYNLFNLCWDQLYLQPGLIKPFLEKFPDNKLVFEKIPGVTNTILVERSDCLPTKPSALQRQPKSS